MKRSKLLICTLCVMNFITSTYSKNSYYYYNGQRVPITLHDDSVRIYVNDRYFDTNELSKYAGKDSVTSIEYNIKGNFDKNIKMSNRFYVQLFDSLVDIHLLQDIARETRTIILGPIPYMSDWYELKVNKSVINNSLELSNYFYETGLFKNVDPGFVFNFTSSSSCVTDSYFTSRQWGMDAIHACDAWDITKGENNIKLAIIDRGVDCSHVEFDANHFYHKYDCHTRTTNGYHVYNEHGTWVCGVIASDHNHARIAGVAPNSGIIPISYSVEDTTMVAADLASGFAWAVSHGADVINCSWGDHNTYAWLHCPLLEASIQNALENGRGGRGCVVIFAAGNQSSTQLDYPGNFFSDIITVGAIKSDYTRRSDSSYGTDLDIVAPGDYIYTTDVGNDYGFTGQTSIAAPFVTGIAGLILAVNPYLTQKEVADIIESTAQKVGGYSYTPQSGRPNGDWNNDVGYGLVDAYAAVTAATEDYYPIQGPDYVCDTAKYYLIHPSQPGDTVLWSVNNGNYAYPHYSIIGANNQDTVYVRCERETPAIPVNPKSQDRQMLMGVQSISVTISNGTSETYTKEFREPTGVKPTVSVSNSAIIWRSGTSRTFTITNCVTAPDSVLTWEVKKTIVYMNGNPNVTTYSYYTGRTLTYIATAPLHAQTMLQFTVTNTLSECEPKSEVLSFAVIRSPFLSAYDGGNILDVTISEDERGETSQQTSEEMSPRTLELWHNIYGSMGTQQVRSDHEQIDITGLPHGVYVLLLKENGEVIA